MATDFAADLGKMSLTTREGTASSFGGKNNCNFPYDNPKTKEFGELVQRKDDIFSNFMKKRRRTDDEDDFLASAPPTKQPRNKARFTFPLLMGKRKRVDEESNDRCTRFKATGNGSVLLQTESNGSETFEGSSETKLTNDPTGSGQASTYMRTIASGRLDVGNGANGSSTGVVLSKPVLSNPFTKEERNKSTVVHGTFEFNTSDINLDVSVNVKSSIANFEEDPNTLPKEIFVTSQHENKQFGGLNPFLKESSFVPETVSQKIKNPFTFSKHRGTFASSMKSLFSSDPEDVDCVPKEIFINREQSKANGYERKRAMYTRSLTKGVFEITEDDIGNPNANRDVTPKCSDPFTNQNLTTHNDASFHCGAFSKKDSPRKRVKGRIRTVTYGKW